MTKFKITEGSEDDKLFLNIHELVVNSEDCKIAYVESIEPSIDKLGRPFVKLLLRDRSGHFITGRIFNIEDFETKGRVILELDKSVVKISFEVGNFEGDITIKVTAIDKIDSDLCSREDFIGELEGVSKSKRFLEDSVNNLEPKNGLFKAIIQQQRLLEGLEYIPMPLYGKRRGGLVVFDEILLNTLESSLNKEEFEKARPIVLITEIYMGAYYMGLTKTDSVFELGDDVSNVIRTSEGMWQVPISNVDKWKPEFKNYYIECSKEGKNLIRCILGFDKPKTFLVNSILTTRQLLYQQQELREVVESMPHQTIKYVKQLNDIIVKL